MKSSSRAATRRDLLIATGACAVAAVAGGTHLLAQGAAPAAKAPAEPPAWLQAIRSVTGEATVTEAKVKLEVPEIAENGNVIPFTVAVDSPMSPDSFVRSVRLYSTANPIPLIATFRLTPACGKAEVTSRLRLAKSQDVVAIAELSDGNFYMAKRSIKVTIGGCGG